MFCVSGRVYDTYRKSVGCHVGTLGEFFLFTKIQDGRQPLFSKKLTIHFLTYVKEKKTRLHQFLFTYKIWLENIDK